MLLILFTQHCDWHVNKWQFYSVFQGDSSVQYYFPRTCHQSSDKQSSLQPEILSSTKAWNRRYSFAIFMVFMLNLACIPWTPLVYKWDSPLIQSRNSLFSKSSRRLKTKCKCCLLRNESNRGSVVFSKWVIINEINKTWSQFLFISTGTPYAFLLLEFKVSPWMFRMPIQYVPTAKKNWSDKLYILQLTLVLSLTKMEKKNVV